jgi:hypothetical protein
MVRADDLYTVPAGPYYPVGRVFMQIGAQNKVKAGRERENILIK